MNDLEKRVTAYLRLAAGDDPVLPASTPAQGAARHGPALVLALVAVVAGLTLGPASLLLAGHGPGAANDPGQRPTASHSARSDRARPQRQAAIERFVQTVINTHPKALQVSVLWDRGVILIAAKPPVPVDIRTLDGRDIEGIRVKVTQARYSPRDADDAVRAVNKVNFPDKNLIAGWNLPAASNRIVVRVRRLDDLTPARRSNLRRHLVQATGVKHIVLRPDLQLGNFAGHALN